MGISKHGSMWHRSLWGLSSRSLPFQLQCSISHILDSQLLCSTHFSSKYSAAHFNQQAISIPFRLLKLIIKYLIKILSSSRMHHWSSAIMLLSLNQRLFQVSPSKNRSDAASRQFNSRIYRSCKNHNAIICRQEWQRAKEPRCLFTIKVTAAIATHPHKS